MKWKIGKTQISNARRFYLPINEKHKKLLRYYPSTYTRRRRLTRKRRKQSNILRTSEKDSEKQINVEFFIPSSLSSHQTIHLVSLPIIIITKTAASASIRSFYFFSICFWFFFYYN